MRRLSLLLLPFANLVVVALVRPPPPPSSTTAFLLLDRPTAAHRRRNHRHQNAVVVSAAAARSETSSSSSSSTTMDAAKKKDPKRRKVAVLVCPAQFCVPKDYVSLEGSLRQYFAAAASKDDNEHDTDDDDPIVEITTVKVAPLPRTEWIKVSKQIPTAAFWRGELPVLKTLDWYFDAVEVALAELLAEINEGENGDDTSICFLGHSIGGWVARAYLGGLSRSATAVSKTDRISSLVTLGTPHKCPETAPVDQTRGLLKAIGGSPSCSPDALLRDRGISVTCVCSNAITGKFLTTQVEEFLAASSYLPLLGSYQGPGDGIVPLELASLDPPARQVIVQACSLTDAPIRHSHVVPTPWSLLDAYAESIVLPSDEFPSYISPGVVPQWAKYIQ